MPPILGNAFLYLCRFCGVPFVLTRNIGEGTQAECVCLECKRTCPLAEVLREGEQANAHFMEEDRQARQNGN